VDISSVIAGLCPPDGVTSIPGLLVLMVSLSSLVVFLFGTFAYLFRVMVSLLSGRDVVEDD